MNLKIREGFSLIEMTVILVIMGIITATLVPLLDTKKVKIKAAQRYASEISSVISAEQNYYMNGYKLYDNNEANLVYHKYTDSLEELENKGFLGSKPVNPFYAGENGKLKLTVSNELPKNFKISFNVPKDTVGVFFNTIPGIKVIDEEGNKVTLEAQINVPSTEIALDNLLHRDEGVDQELRTSHGPIQITNNVEAGKSFLYVTDDNINTPQQLLTNNLNVAENKGILQIGIIDNNNIFGIKGGNKDNELVISANRNSVPGKLYIGISSNKDNSLTSNGLNLGIKNTVFVKLFSDNTAGGYESGMKIFGKTAEDDNEGKLIEKQYLSNSGGILKSKTEIISPVAADSYNTQQISRKVTEVSNSSIKEKFILDQKIEDENDLNNQEIIEYKDKTKPLSFIGSIGGLFTVKNGENIIAVDKVGTDCAGGKGKWSLRIIGIKYFENNTNNSDYNYDFTSGFTSDSTVNVELYRGYYSADDKIMRLENSSTRTVKKKKNYYIYGIYDTKTVNNGQFIGDVRFKNSTNLSVKTVIKEAPGIVNGINTYLYTSNGYYKLGCKAKINYVKDYKYKIKYYDIDCAANVMLICLPKNKYNNNYN